ncbi:Myelin-oligodendrocyte glycoprotein [Frankliniella fusca]|uniref:Myelin-oligodendrocyte glycoprotein n=1 Tax=Frankliniella fusca TaxID=407009 RepID=A0AAE1HYR1_9NEOP|nr:Myelin-oligodendrocyte glycoprotein [Frankliniella fusca]
MSVSLQSVLYVPGGLQQRDLSGLVGETVQLPCHVDTASCGTVHSVKWYRGSSRIYVFSEMAVVDHAEGDYVDR